MPTSYLTASLPIWPIFDNTGQPSYNGFLDTRSALNNNIPKLIFRDPAGLNPYPYPTPLSDLGRTSSLIYWADDEEYEVRFLDQNGQITDVISNFAPNGTGGGGPPVTVTIDLFNHLLNPQFAFPLDIPTTLPATPFEFVRGGWTFHKSNTNVTDTLAMVPFILGQTDVPGEPKYYISYVSTNVGAGGETFKDIIFPLCNVIGFNGAQISLGGWIKSTTISAVQVIFRQYFGTGGAPSPTVDTVAGSFNGTAVWSQDTVTTTVPSVAGKSLGSNNDDQIYLIFRLPLNQIIDVELASFQFVNGGELPPVIHQTDSYEHALIVGSNIPFPNKNGTDTGKAVVVTGTNFALGYPNNQPFPVSETTILGEIIINGLSPLMPATGSAPLISQGVELATVTITPGSLNAKIKVEVEIGDYNFFGTGSSVVDTVLALFNVSQTSALRASLLTFTATISIDNTLVPIYTSMIDAPNTLSPVTYSVRAGFATVLSPTDQLVINPNTGPNVGDVGAIKFRAITISP